MSLANNKDSLILSAIVRALRENDTPPKPIPANSRRAGVALILRALGKNLSVLFIQRALREEDPWSGHIAFPGGHYDLSDTDVLHTVVRETKEEVGITLTFSDCVTQLPVEKPYTSDQRTDLVVLPYVFALTYEPELYLNHEVSEVIWVPLNRLISGELITNETVNFNSKEYQLPGFRLNDRHFVWGLTYRVLQRFCSIIDQT
ncbi:MAG: CoA pyrophosphatase [Gammaproteobacteria bacterium]|nr:CoA pyrophosphatase [Gammaproteobacteria bacterium]MYF01608.1 CoA pyrophosphatase [Gammaproteobacteria bacterium]MYI76305.1 CoA pyrophosphatase [Gammaproteobacteria bacterium]